MFCYNENRFSPREDEGPMLHSERYLIFLSDQMWVLIFFNVGYRYGRTRVIQVKNGFAYY